MYAYRERSQAFLKYEALHRQKAATKVPLQKILPKQFLLQMLYKVPLREMVLLEGQMQMQRMVF